MNYVERTHRARATLIACGAALLWSAGAVLAAEPQHTERPPPTKEMREQMAKAHEQMAACLRSDRAIADCHAEMKKYHDMMDHDHEMQHHDHAMQHPPATEAGQQ